MHPIWIVLYAVQLLPMHDPNPIMCMYITPSRTRIEATRVRWFSAARRMDGIVYRIVECTYMIAGMPSEQKQILVQQSRLLGNIYPELRSLNAPGITALRCADYH